MIIYKMILGQLKAHLKPSKNRSIHWFRYAFFKVHYTAQFTQSYATISVSSDAQEEKTTKYLDNKMFH